MLQVAVVEDEADLREELCEFLRLSGMQAEGLGGWNELEAHLAAAPCDAVVLDINLPDEDGFRIASRLIDREGLGVVMVTSRVAQGDRIRGLRSGADAYLTKPVDLAELVATLESVCRRTRRPRPGPAQPAAAPAPRAAEEPAWELRRLGWELRGPNGRSATLTAAEHDFLKSVAANPGRPVERAELLGLPDTAPESSLRRLDAVVRRLRRKVEASIGLALPVRSVHGVGYASTDRILVADGES
ncbi:response regulator transcription factor [Novispirillum sp. DQ9]|uniref:response regulator transcription factor n=1 Tax=Novispirillum sp. DQ9 TaxID=3398612 RepID=UPI003C7D5923